MSKALQLPRGASVMGVLNVTPDSFSDGGRFLNAENAREQVADMVAAGADWIDVGGESTRPGAAAVSAQEELDRVIPVIESIRRDSHVRISIDTSKPEVMRAAVAAGAVLINDVRALRVDGALAAAAELQVPVCLMHMQRSPGTMQENPEYEDVVAEVTAFLRQRVSDCVAAGFPAELLLLDPGFGFGKTLAHNVALLANLAQVAALGYPVLVGMSRKTMLGQLTDREVDERGAAGLAAAVIAVSRGARIVRTHDVAATVDALKVTRAILDWDDVND